MKRFLCIWVVAMGVWGLASVCWAKTVYVTDVLEITLCTGPSIENKIIKMVSSGQSLELLESGEGWSRVRIQGTSQDGVEGWVLDRYLMQRLPWGSQVKSLKEENALVKEKLPRLEKQLKTTLQKEQELEGALKASTDNLKRLEEGYETLKNESSEYLELKESSEKMTAALETSETKSRQLEKENERLRSSERNRWFISGALVLICGLVIGLILGKQQKKRKSLYY
ncbi:MAG: TIGR04211 family SH3 domain-containing protein [Deltaproteobacteria bacterium]|nr:TIGR04211 family SH3 domain-containing protein [Deltaproteobacteria bacterium]